MSVEYMLTTIDNPFNPFVDFDRWYGFDITQGHYTCEYIARIAIDGALLTDEERSDEYNRAIQWILDNDVFGLYVRVTKDNADYIIAKNMKRSKDSLDNTLDNSLDNTLDKSLGNS